MKTQQYAKELQMRNGIDKAIKIAHNSMKHTEPSVWANLPVGTVWHNKGDNNTYTFRKKEMQRLYSFWVEVYNILRKMDA